MPLVPHDDELHRALPQAPVAHAFDIGLEAHDVAPGGGRRVNARRLWIAQRLTAMLLAVCVFAHLATIVYAVQGGLTAAEILGRTRGSITWAAFYGVFVLAVAVHAPLGLRTIVAELARRDGAWLDAVMVLFALLLVIGGMRAVAAVTIT